jgi:UDP-glucose 4-epimerase
LALGNVRPLAWVTGATGFLGRNVALALAKQGYDVAGFVRHSDLNVELTSGWGFRFIEHGPFDAQLLRRAVEHAGPPVVVFHAIGSGSVAQADADPGADKQRTLRTTECLLEKLAQTAPQARLIYPSSAAVYGDVAAGAIAEDAPTRPISAYGANKLAAEAICNEFAKGTGRQGVVIARFFSLYGPPQRKLLLWEVGQRLLAGERDIALGGTGEEARDFLHITDAAGIVATLAAAADPPSLLNVGSGRATSVRTLVETLASFLGVSVKIRFDGHSRPGNPPYQQADVSRLARIGFKASVPLELGLADYARWLRSKASER